MTGKETKKYTGDEQSSTGSGLLPQTVFVFVLLVLNLRLDLPSDLSPFAFAG
jgi:hypothetical protein